MFGFNIEKAKKKKKKKKRCGSADCAGKTCGCRNRSGDEDVSGDINKSQDKQTNPEISRRLVVQIKKSVPRVLFFLAMHAIKDSARSLLLLLSLRLWVCVWLTPIM